MRTASKTTLTAGTAEILTDMRLHLRSMFMAEMSGATFWQGSDTESEVSSDDSSESGDEKEDKLKDDGEDPFNEDEESLENPLQTPNAEADSDAPSARPVENKRLFFEVGILAEQGYCSGLRTAEHRVPGVFFSF